MKKLVVPPAIALLLSTSIAFAQVDDQRQKEATAPPTQLISPLAAIDHRDTVLDSNGRASSLLPAPRKGPHDQIPQPFINQRSKNHGNT